MVHVTSRHTNIIFTSVYNAKENYIFSINKLFGHSKWAPRTGIILHVYYTVNESWKCQKTRNIDHTLDIKVLQ